ncbi:ATP:cob(I)alamin adenosyltransferase [Rhodovulum imhoffii]|uniref:Corrinoid adenosyltransferase n=1 Tax=Rhodovulum imhoffii TaxID=365340 RepID=A0A2T5BUQ7_9RHOB|nr:cob(I)yrinic acid a,c-diamide adenosyltransferase [Rhodovulum imhoffii]MBK5934853.1 ATP:cob(I)alamin adenosyltransferase [Rhodovulum imhoffii]PTN03254.1 ATP:cob(I)alamin adenosyltransferase [Rhodovulum imhoffii]
MNGKIYTRRGDTGETRLGDGTPAPKHGTRMRAYGMVDEINAAIGLARLQADGAVDARLSAIQHDLFDLGADLHKDKADDRPLRITADQVARLETEIDAASADLPALQSFILPGGTPLAAHLHACCTVARRAECLTARLASEESVNPQALAYLNRLSDWLFVAARAANGSGAQDMLWRPAADR